VLKAGGGFTAAAELLSYIGREPGFLKNYLTHDKPAVDEGGKMVPRRLGEVRQET
jgi:hypothetical protein